MTCLHKDRPSHLTFGRQIINFVRRRCLLSVSEPDTFNVLHIDGDNRHVDRDLVEDEIVADGINGLLIARYLRRKECRKVVDGVRRLYGATARTDVFVRVVVRNGGKCDVRIRRELDDLLVVLERGEVDAAFLRT